MVIRGPQRLPDMQGGRMLAGSPAPRRTMLTATETPLFTDLYQLTMAQGYYLAGKADDRAVFDVFFRTTPFDGGYCVFAGLGEVLPLIAEMRFGDDEREFLRANGFDDAFVDWLADFRFRGDIWSVREGEIVFPRTPILRVHGTLIEAQLVETLLLNMVNFQSLVATKAHRMVDVAGDARQVIDFGLRRAQGLGGMQASRAAAVGGCVSTSNVLAARRYGLAMSGTQAHSWVQSFDDELAAFRAFADAYGDRTVLLVDTWDTLGSGVPNAITVAKELAERGQKLAGIRLDSGDLAYLSRKARRMLDEAGLHDVQIAASNNLDEHLIKSLLEQDAPIDVFGVGTRLVTAWDDPALDGVYKLAFAGGRDRMKVSDNIEKTTLPGIKRTDRFYNDDGTFYGDGIALESEPALERIHHPLYPDMRSSVAELDREPLLAQVMASGAITDPLPTPAQASAYRAERFAKLPDEHKRFHNPHVYKVGISPGLVEARRAMMPSATGYDF